MERQIRVLVEQYYDIQKLRVEAFNRVVAYVKSHANLETQPANASHVESENQFVGASQGQLETHFVNASQNKLETQPANASHKSHETHLLGAKPSVLAHQIVTLKVEVPKEISEVVWFHNSLHETEKQLAKRLDGWSREHKIRLNYLREIKGIGPIFSSGLIAWFEPISRFDNISKLWSYCGLSPTQKRVKGKKLGYNPRLKTLMWKIGSSFEKQKSQKSQYRKLYETQKNYYLNRADLKAKIETKEKGIKGHIRNMTLRYVEKRFLADLWLTWRKLEGLPITEPYAIAILKHEHFEKPKTDR